MRSRSSTEPYGSTYAQWQERIGCVVSGLQRRGVGPGDASPPFSRTASRMATLYWATQLLGATFTPVNWRLSRDELAFIIENAEPRCVVSETATAFEELIAGFSATSTAPVSDEAHSIMLYTSGTTGHPKGVLRTHRAERAAAAHISPKTGTLARTNARSDAALSHDGISFAHRDDDAQRYIRCNAAVGFGARASICSNASVLRTSTSHPRYTTIYLPIRASNSTIWGRCGSSDSPARR